MGKEIEADKAALHVLRAAGQGEEVMAVVPAETEPGIVTIREGRLETLTEEPKTPPAQPEPPGEPPDKPAAEPPAGSSAESLRPGLIIWKNFPRKQ
ncbi:MAG: hypothetical protein M1379_04195 [Firmicutes bacterium]|nr:hypothetical protein [Bacillota bacterium]